ncbi:hypothetical protein BH753_gp019 [Bacillus phage Shbh1]|uniref:Uncharacterized protein n=1 Tax=Bacillus phage Shbh1 TaxID=1796992 RepID=A0A142F144_9CAUD|nr:hypothetical protein BH753_gp019 [Bacillus phage Shbh1]AMQ66501.1 hypothetical protein [Bacillus phage Shbh1]
MSTKPKGKRKPLYLSEVTDKDILDYIKPLLGHYNFSLVIRELVRDGMRYREQGKGVGEPSSTLSSHPSHKQPEQSVHVLQSDTNNLSSSLQNIELKAKEVSKEDIENRLDSF